VAPAGRLRLFYLLYYANVGIVLPYLAPYLRGLGFSGEQIGLVQTGPALLAPAVALGWAAWADRRASAVRALRRASAWVAFAALGLPFAGTPLAVAGVVLAMALADRAVVPLVDSATLEWCRAAPPLSYARVRLFGSLGFVLAAVGLGVALTARGERAGDPLVPWIVVLCLAGYAAVARSVPEPPVHGEPRPGLGDVRALLSDRPLLVLLAASAVHWAACAPYHLFFGVLVRDLGLPARVAGAGMGVGVVAEIAVLLAYPRIARRVPLRAQLAIAFLGTTVRWLLVARTAGAASLVALQILHGLTFGLFWGAVVSAMSEAVPGRLRATGQALFTAVVFGGGNAAGYALSGIGYDRLGAQPLFGWAAAAEIVPLILGLTLPLRRRVRA
jgi:PPP family 3-phenylpropionic acid transporter